MDDRTTRSLVVLAVIVVGLLALGGGIASCSAHGPAGGQGEEVASLPPLRPTDIARGLDYSLDKVAASGLAPKLFIKDLDYDLSRIPDVGERKRTFFRILLPIVARENQRIRDARKRILADPRHVDPKLYAEYQVKPGDVKTLLRRCDVVPTSLVLAQAAVESGWGSSRFALEGNNLFGVHSYTGNTKGIDPKNADGFTVVSYSSLEASVRDYMLTLNSHPAYAKLRQVRAAMRKQGEPLHGAPLTGLLGNYSEVPGRYGSMLRQLIEDNHLARFDGVRLNS